MPFTCRLFLVIRECAAFLPPESRSLLSRTEGAMLEEEWSDIAQLNFILPFCSLPSAHCLASIVHQSQHPRLTWRSSFLHWLSFSIFALKSTALDTSYTNADSIIHGPGIDLSIGHSALIHLALSKPKPVVCSHKDVLCCQQNLGSLPSYSVLPSNPWIP